MAISTKDIAGLWQRYTTEAVPAGISVNHFFESNGVPYHVFEKWYKKKFQAPNVVECVVTGAAKSGEATPSNVNPTSSDHSSTAADGAIVVKYINLGLSNGMKIEHHNLSYRSLQNFIEKLQSLCLA